MSQTGTKAAAEAALRELPSVIGAFVREDVQGHPREIHLLVKPGPEPRHLARDIRDLLEERLGVPIDQRVISIAQVGDEAGRATRSDAGATPPEPAPPRVPPGARPAFVALDTTAGDGRSAVRVRLHWRGEEQQGRGEAVDSEHGRARAALAATLDAAKQTVSDDLRLEPDFVTIVQALEGSFALVGVLVHARRFGRHPLQLVGAQPIDADIETATALASLKAINRVLTLALSD